MRSQLVRLPRVGDATAHREPFEGISVTDGAVTIAVSSMIREGKILAIEISTLGQSTTAKERNDLPPAFRLLGNYPNPFNPTANIVFETLSRVQVAVEVFNVMGRKVIEIPAQSYLSGEHKIAIDGSGLASGIYLYRIIASTNNQKIFEVGRIALIK